MDDQSRIIVLDEYKPPFPWFGGKSRVAPQVWERFGDVPNYVEPFFGSGAVLFGRPYEPHTETVNDKDAYVSNFWRALQADPDTVTYFASWPVSEADLHARHLWLVRQKEFRERMLSDPDYYDPKIAGWWAWGICQWIGTGWCNPKYFNAPPPTQLVSLSSKMGVNRPMQHPSRQLPHLDNPGRGVHRPTEDNLLVYMRGLSDRLRRVRVCCGEWHRILGPSVTLRLGLTAVFLDPPYATEKRTNVYALEDRKVGLAAMKWAIENGDNPELRIALCGNSSDYNMPDTWEVVSWKRPGGYASQGERHHEYMAAEETIYFSPYCLKPVKAEQLSLF